MHGHHEPSVHWSTLPSKLHHEFWSLPIALTGIPTPVLDDVEAMIANHLLECVWRIALPGDFQHRVLDPCTSYGAVIDQLRVEDAPLQVEAGTSLHTPEAHAVDRHLPLDDFGRRPPCLLHALEAARGMKHIQDATAIRCKMRPKASKQPLDLGISFQQLKHTIRGDDQIEGPAQGKVGDIAEFRLGFGGWKPCGTHLLEAAREHGLGLVDAMDRAARCCEREQHAAGPAAQFQY